jgi:tetratricopeptide (TPR) repeat protein
MLGHFGTSLRGKAHFGEYSLISLSLSKKNLETWLLSSGLVHPLLLSFDHRQLGRALGLLRYRLSQEQFARYCIAMGDFFRQHGELRVAEKAYSTALARGDLHGEHSALGEALIRRGDIYSQLGKWKESKADLTQGRKIHRDLKNEAGVIHADSLLAIHYAAGGNVKKARLYLDRTLGMSEKVEPKHFLGATLMNLGVVYQILGDVKTAIAQFQRARSHFEEAGDLQRLGEVCFKLGMSYLAAQSVVEAQRSFELCHSLSTKISDRTLTGLALFGRAKVSFLQKDLRLALSLADQALDNLSIHGDSFHVAEVYRLKGTIHRKMKNVEFAHWYLYTSLRMHTDLQNIYSIGKCYFQLGKLHTIQRKPQVASKMFQKSIEAFRKGGAAAEAAGVLSELNRVNRRTT